MPSDVTTPKQTLYCSFCGKTQHEVRKLIAGPTTFICDECIFLCEDILLEDDKTGNVHYFNILFQRIAIDEALQREGRTGRHLVEDALGITLSDGDLANLSYAEVINKIATHLAVRMIRYWEPDNVDRCIAALDEKLFPLKREAEDARATIRTYETLVERRAALVAARDSDQADR